MADHVDDGDVGASGRTKVLVVEDSRTQALALQADLHRHGFAVVMAFNGRQGLEVAARERPDVVLSDVLMPDIDGFRFCRELQLDPELAAIPVILRSAAFLDEEDRNLALAMGAYAYIEKEVEGLELARILNRALQDERKVPKVTGSIEAGGLGSSYAGRLLSHLVEQAAHAARVNEDLKQTQQLLQAVMDNSPALVWVKDLNARYLMVNDQYCRKLGVTPEEVIGKTASAIFGPEHGEEHDQNFSKVVEAGRAMEFEETALHDGRLHTYLSSIYPLKNDDGTIYALCGISIDITERKLLEERLRQAEKTEVIGRLAGGIAHDFNNLLSIIINYAAFASQGLAESDHRAQDISEVIGAARRGADLVRQLMTFARGGEVGVEVVDVNEAISQAERLLRGLLGSRMAIKLELESDLPPVRINSDQLGQVLLNLVVNARDAMPDGGTVSISTDEVTFETVLCEWNCEIAPGRYVRLSVTDMGTGIRPETMQRIFDPFFTTKPEGSGTGLGLPTIQGIVKGVGGGITVESKLGEGTTFHVYLPLATEANEPVVAEESAVIDGRDGVILLAEDDEAARLMLQRTLRQGGYEVLVAASGEEAVAIHEEHGDRVALLVTDISMAGMSGLALGERLTAGHPGLQVIYMSGTVDMRDSQPLPPGAWFLPKPFTPAEFLTKVQRTMGAPDRSGSAGDAARDE